MNFFLLSLLLLFALCTLLCRQLNEKVGDGTTVREGGRNRNNGNAASPTDLQLTTISSKQGAKRVDYRMNMTLNTRWNIRYIYIDPGEKANE